MTTPLPEGERAGHSDQHSINIQSQAKASGWFNLEAIYCSESAFTYDKHSNIFLKMSTEASLASVVFFFFSNISEKIKIYKHTLVIYCSDYYIM